MKEPDFNLIMNAKGVIKRMGFQNIQCLDRIFNCI